MSEKRFHGTQHFKGGFDIDESTLSPNANYWKRYARGSYDALVKLVGEKEASELSENVLYNTEKTWKERWSILEDILTKKENDDTMNKTLSKSLPVKAFWVGTCGGQSEGRIGGCGKTFDIFSVKKVKDFMKCPHCGYLN